MIPEVRLLEEDDWGWRRGGPTQRAVTAYDVDATRLHRLPGGAGHTWSDGRVVLKPVGCVPEHDWVCEVYAGWRSDEVRVPEPVRPSDAAGGSWSCDGWGAHVFVPGRDADPRHELPAVMAAGDAFHRAVAGLPRPAFLDARDDPWAFGDRLAWEDAAPVGDAATLEVVERLLAACRPVREPSQVVHGDVTGNVLLQDGESPAVIDWPPYFRPVGFASAVAVTDAVTFHDAPLPLIDEWRRGDDWDQLLLRAVLYRLGPTGVFAAHGRLMGVLQQHVEQVRPLVAELLRRL